MPTHDGAYAKDPPERSNRSQTADRPVVLVAEDEAIIAFELADSLHAAGFDVAGPFDTCAGAEAWLRGGGHADAAVLDNALRDGPCRALARDLRQQRVPFIVHSGHSRSSEIASEFAHAPWIVKPVTFEALLHELRSVMCP